MAVTPEVPGPARDRPEKQADARAAGDALIPALGVTERELDAYISQATSKVIVDNDGRKIRYYRVSNLTRGARVPALAMLEEAVRLSPEEREAERQFFAALFEEADEIEREFGLPEFSTERDS